MSKDLQDINALSPGSERDKFSSGVFLLTFSAIAVKILGLIYKIPMLKLIGGEGMGYFNTAYELYTMFGVISSAGLPVAMSVLISSDMARGGRNVGRIYSVSRTLFLCVGIVGSLSMILLARPISLLLKSENAYYSILAISPSVLFICLSSVLRGYFQGHGKMGQTAVSQIIEAGGKLVFGVVLSLVAMYFGMNTQMTAGMAVLGLTLSLAFSAIFLSIARVKVKTASVDALPDAKKSVILRGILATAVPITLSSMVLSITKIIDMTMILRGLQSIGFSSEAANEIYGNYTTLCLPLFALAPALTVSIALPLVPAVSSAHSSGDITEQNRILSVAFSTSTLVSMPISLGLTFFSRPILQLLFAGETEAIAASAPWLSVLGLSVVMSCIITVQNSALQAFGCASLPIISMLIGAMIKTVLAFVLIREPNIGIIGAPISTFMCDLAISGINFMFLSKRAPGAVKLYGVFIKPFACALASCSVGIVLLRICENAFGESRALTVAAIMLVALIYAVLSFLSGNIKSDTPIFGRMLLKNKK